MSRDINIGFRLEAGGLIRRIEVRPPYFILGTQAASKRFWSLPRLQEIGVTRLAELGETDPVYFVGWDMLEDLRREIDLIDEHLASIDFDPDLKASWLAHLIYCYHLLVQTAPKDSTPQLSIG